MATGWGANSGKLSHYWSRIPNGFSDFECWSAWAGIRVAWPSAWLRLVTPPWPSFSGIVPQHSLYFPPKGIVWERAPRRIWPIQDHWVLVQSALLALGNRSNWIILLWGLGRHEVVVSGTVSRSTGYFRKQTEVLPVSILPSEWWLGAPIQAKAEWCIFLHACFGWCPEAVLWGQSSHLLGLLCHPALGCWEGFPRSPVARQQPIDRMTLLQVRYDNLKSSNCVLKRDHPQSVVVKYDSWFSTTYLSEPYWKVIHNFSDNGSLINLCILVSKACFLK